MKPTKKGFTLIELMVVIVIIGILAAIAIPKLFGMTAKAKAQEVPGAAGTWSKLQAAYLVETSNLGTVTSIAYRHPGQSTYSPNHAGVNFSYGAPNPSATEASWSAAPKAGLNEECGTTATWGATITSENVVSATVTAGCENLTPNFKNLK